MKLTKEALKQLIKEELDLMKEAEKVSDVDVAKKTMQDLRTTSDRLNPIFAKWIDTLLDMDPAQINSVVMQAMLKKLGDMVKKDTPAAPATKKPEAGV